MKQYFWLLKRSIFLDIKLFSEVPYISWRKKFVFVYHKYLAILLSHTKYKKDKVKKGKSFTRDFYFNDEFATGLLQSIYVHNHRLRKYIQPDAVIVDIGANIGQFCTFAQHYLRASNVISFEPLAEPFNSLQLNNKHVSLQIAIGADNGLAELYIDDRDIFASLVVPADTGSGLIEKRMIEVRRLDSIDVIARLNRIDLLKIDTEGSEFDIVKASPLAINKASYIMIECSINRSSIGDIAQIMSYISEVHPNFHVVDVMNPLSRQGRLECIDVLWENRNWAIKV